MVATTSEKNDHLLKFKNLAAVIKLQLRGTQTIRGIYIRANNNEPLSGGYTAQALFNKHEGPTLFPYTRTWNYVFLRCDEEVKLDRYETTPFYISIPPTDFTNGFTIEIVDTEGNSYTKTAARTNVERSSILVMPTLTVNKLEVVEDVIDIPEDGSSVDITVKCGGNWYTSHAPEWLNISSEKVSEDTYVVSVSMKENYATYDYENTYIEFESFLASDRVTVLKERPISTVEEVNTGVEGEEYRLKGYVTDITNTSYGNWSLMDETGSIYIYGTAKEGYYKSFSTFGIEAGDIVTIQGPREKYGDIIRLNTATVVNIEKSLIKIKEVVGLEGNMIPVEGAEFSIKVDCAGNDITVNIPEGTQSWLSSNSTEWINDTEAVVYFTAQAAPKGARPVKITFETYSDEGVKHINQIGLVQYGNIIECTIEEFLKEPVSEYCLYKLTGTVENIKNATYGNFYLNDGTGTVFVYGLTTKGEIGANDKSFASIGLEEGDILTLVGTRTEYNGTPQVGGQAYYVSHISNN
jgi:DNA/RNA endonuclease YhcR with UshA esterase domain